MDRRDVDDATALPGDHARQHLLRDEPGGLQIDAEHIVPVLLRHCHRIGIGIAPGVVDQSRNRAEALHSFIMHPGDVSGDADAARAEMTAAGVQGLDEGMPRLFLEIDDGNSGVFRQRFFHDGCAYATAAAGHEDMLLRESARHHQSATLPSC